ncbi:hypothetical protein CC85DRAFT_281759 [Cutaneotrichosporon oleaginosum]|uniref:histidine kinase n=1 Tax=Cutaneotrichosporon oleaginosum TaxID=879819 RepID=A0A0J0XYI2_9TREE|nr:uncharacterized protein CC85DRAFT_281759 [Cutaneotrichosporon oleaginosum]KLT46117.1 hypothetical protein CC85DRAFT_281759 [Cutaneotrichosporon oleaginosum]TXT10129.1 hypothetical protein COLE_04063 [Cutaneotrichosporon oleaginosum]
MSQPPSAIPRRLSVGRSHTSGSVPTTSKDRVAVGRIPRHERAPTTDAEWEEALRYYGVDRRSGDHSEAREGDVAAQPSQLLIHNESDDSYDFLAPSDVSNGGESPGRTKLPMSFDMSRDLHILGGTAADDSHKSTPSGTPEHEFTQHPEFVLLPTLDALSFTTLQTHASIGAFEHTYKVLHATKLPRTCRPDEDSGHLCVTGERQRLRRCYEQDGWLQAPNPSQALREKRSRVLRRLGLNDPNELGERFAVLSRYCELAQLVLGADSSSVSILRGDNEDVYLPNRNFRCWSFPNGEAYGGHAVLHPEGRCFVVADMDKDWRFAKNPGRLGGRKRKFFAAAPLRYYRPGGDFVDFGMLSIAGDAARDTFDVREQSTLLRLANMLVYQLATLQSEIMAKKSSAMYEASINFLRRSLVPEHLKLKPEDPDSAKAAETAKSLKPRKTSISRLKKSRYSRLPRSGGARALLMDARSRLPNIAVNRAVSGAQASSAQAVVSPAQTPLTPASNRSEASVDMPQLPQRAVKTAPRDSRRAKRRDLRAETTMFNDAAETLRGILHADAVCMVDLHEYQLYIRKGGTTPENQPTQTRESIVADFLQGKEWPANVEPVVKYVPRTDNLSVEIMGQNAAPGFEVDFNRPNATETIAKFAKTYLATSHFWWDREDPNDELAQEIMAFMPSKCQTVLSTVFLTFDGMLRYAVFVSWERSPRSFDDSSRLALPFVWIIGAALTSGLAISRIRSVEESQITYSNLQAHELRTPLHQILTITHLLRSSMSDLADAGNVGQVQSAAHGCMTTLEQVRDLLPLLDAIDTSGKTLHGIVDNILTFLDLTGKDKLWESSRVKHPALFGHSSSAPQTLRAMLEDLVQEAYDEDRRGRAGSGEAQGHIETVLEIVSKDLGDLVTEDRGGALRRALGRLISNAYRYIDGPGCVEIYVDDIEGYLPPEGCEDLSNTRRVAITIVDNGRGMSLDFVDNKLGEPWAKEDLFATGSGLSVHLAYRIIDLMGGEMEISSAPGDGCTISIQVPLPIAPSPPSLTPTVTTVDGAPRKVAVLGFDRPGGDLRCGLDRLGASLERQYASLGCDIAPAAEADLIVMDGGFETDDIAPSMLTSIEASEVVIFEADGDRPGSLPLPPTTELRRLHKPITPSLIRTTLSRTPARVSMEFSNGDSAFNRPRPVRLQFDSESIARSEKSSQAEKEEKVVVTTSKSVCKTTKGLSTLFGWKSRGMCVEEAVASLCLGDYFSSRGRARLPSGASTGSSGSSFPATSPSEDAGADTDPLASPGLGSTPSSPWLGTESTPVTTPSEEAPITVPPAPTPHPMTVLVVEDNMVNRKILVRILKTSGLDLNIRESEDGADALEQFKQLALERPLIVLLDINMPNMDGFTAASEMRLAEKRLAAGALSNGARSTTPAVRSKIFAITALAGEDEKRRGLVECGMDCWLTKPCSKVTLQKVVEEACDEFAKLGL